ncbi:30S ribosomal protein S9 [Thecamonas trahens ATCC 50062]|uniref:30S ribosomal protein S9 n=1 Tax=Thecamonas trahens ATCC 50062 TaxID=461836 RepID=A0A0L0D3D9_THETB|nr:30S ribosomal protein S9 [Thecamonas trahens ATCC 50062]KNC46686.1 30S ribosomal protein S9 [Thecamonas trahens ATCC 50062]|eukprot:XP_013760454.1 30S ribosomal protein S9 [Thecamonas trahens ATCC 50062]
MPVMAYSTSGEESKADEVGADEVGADDLAQVIDVLGSDDLPHAPLPSYDLSDPLGALEPELPPLDDLWQEHVLAANAKKATEMTAHESEQLERRKAKTLDALGRAYGTGRRKTSIARVWVEPVAHPAAPQPADVLVVNSKPLADYFPAMHHRNHVIEPLRLLGKLGAFKIRATVKGGGHTGQAGALRLGICRALEIVDPAFRKPLKAAGMMTRDPRMVERKLAGLRKARRAPQWVKR